MKRYTLAEIRATVRGEIPADHRVYVIRDGRGRALYVGRSANPWTRVRSHAIGAAWSNPGPAAETIGAAGSESDSWLAEFWTPAEVLRRAARVRRPRHEFVAAAELALIGLERPTLNGCYRWWADELIPDALAASLMEGVPE